MPPPIAPGSPKRWMPPRTSAAVTAMRAPLKTKRKRVSPAARKSASSGRIHSGISSVASMNSGTEPSYLCVNRSGSSVGPNSHAHAAAGNRIDASFCTALVPRRHMPRVSPACCALPTCTIMTSDSGVKTMSTIGMWNDATANSAKVAASKLADTAYCEK